MMVALIGGAMERSDPADLGEELSCRGNEFQRLFHGDRMRAPCEQLYIGLRQRLRQTECEEFGGKGRIFTPVQHAQAAADPGEFRFVEYDGIDERLLIAAEHAGKV